VAVAFSGVGNRVMTSSNGTIWLSQTSASDNEWNGVCWAPELSLFVAVAQTGSGDRVMTSANGTSWTLRTSAGDYSWKCVCWSSELQIFVAVAFTNSGIMTSYDGITWTLRSAPASNQLNSVCWSPELGIFVAVAMSGANNRVITSPDGISWTSRTSAANAEWLSVCWSPQLSLFVAVSYDGGSNGVMYSSNGTSWILQATPSSGWTGLCWSPELSCFVSVSQLGTTMTSAIGMPNSKSVVKALPSQVSVDSLGNMSVSGYFSAGNMGMFRNRVINGDMRVNQRNITSASPATTTGSYGVDRWRIDLGGTPTSVSHGQYTLSSTTDAIVYNQGFRWASVINRGSGGTAIHFRQYIELSMIEDLYNSVCSLSFWARVTANGTVYINYGKMTNGSPATTTYLPTSSASVTNTWQQFKFILPVGTITSSTGALNTYGGDLMFVLDLLPSSTLLYVTGVQLEKGSIATPFEFRPFAIELALCQRYYCAVPNINGVAATGFGRVITTNNGVNNQLIGGTISFPVTMRASPSVTLFGGNSSTGGVTYYTSGSGTQAGYNLNANNVFGNNISSVGSSFYSSVVTIGANYMVWIDMGWTGGCLGLKAECEF
jgi:hypothetical protein